MPACCLTVDDPLSDRYTISCLIERIWGNGFADILNDPNQKLLLLGMLSPEMYADSSLVKANVHGHRISGSGLTVAEFQERAIGGNGPFLTSESGVDENGTAREETWDFEYSKGHVPLSPADTDARWRAEGRGEPPRAQLPGQRHGGPGRLDPFPGSHPSFQGAMPCIPTRGQ